MTATPGTVHATSETGEAATVRLHRTSNAFISHVDDGIEGLLGWTPEQLIGSPSTELIHPQDHASAVAAWMQMLDEPGTTQHFRGRYLAADGAWVWVETVNTNLLDLPGTEAVVTEMQAVEASGLSLEEQLRERQQLLNQLSDALPVGLVHFDAEQQVISTNDRLHDILDRGPGTAIDDLFSDIAADDQETFRRAVVDVLDGMAVDDIEIRLEADHGSRVGSLSLRSLTGAAGELTGAIGCVLDVTERVRLRDQLERRASTDALTGCANRPSIIGLLDHLLEAVDEVPTGVGVIYVDLDRFKCINDTYGHALGDEVIVTIAQRLRRALRSVDHLGRIGGDEFVAVCPGVVDAAAAHEIADRVAKELQGAFTSGGTTIDLAASVGVAFEAESASADELIARADHAMYSAKRGQQTSPVLAAP